MWTLYFFGEINDDATDRGKTFVGEKRGTSVVDSFYDTIKNTNELCRLTFFYNILRNLIGGGFLCCCRIG